MANDFEQRMRLAGWLAMDAFTRMVINSKDEYQLIGPSELLDCDEEFDCSRITAGTW